ncbi:zinc finger, ZZ type domain-containing protein [Sarocladium implicatum]|nr:zinc finger, ZZ type domain-containing protein [Sarocladium implicatum]
MPLSLPTPLGESLTRPRIAIAAVSVAAAISFGYYAYLTNTTSQRHSSAGGLHRSNAVRRNRRSTLEEAPSNTSEDTPIDENAENTIGPTADGETVVGGPDDFWDDNAEFQPVQRAGHNIVNLLFRVSEDNARRNGCVHRGCQCNACGMVPIRGVRYRCANCADFDLCESCEAQGVHIKTHIFYKIKVPAPPFGPRQMQPVWYTGDPDSCRRSLPRSLIAKWSRGTGFERPELEAIWEQWTFMANTEWRDDPDDLCVAMDRKTFERCLVPTGGSKHAAPNLIHDRMFHFYDRNNDGLISFPEFLLGLAYRNRNDKLQHVFRGYDIDEDGLVDRKDFLRMFRAYYVLFKQMHKDILDGQEDQLLASTEAAQLVSSRQPLSSLFGREGRVPPADGGPRTQGKTVHRDGRIDVEEGFESAIANNRTDVSSRQDILTSLFAWGSDPSRHSFASRAVADGRWTVQPVGVSETDRAYLVTLMDPPASLDMLPDILMGTLADNDDLDDEDEDGDNEENGDDENEDATESEARARMLARNRRRAPMLERRRREMARDQLHERWRRRQFYLDEEEGGEAPEDWTEEEDIIYNSVRQADAEQNGGPSAWPRRRHSGDWPSFSTVSDHLTNGKGRYESDNAIEDDSATDTSVEDDPELDELEHIFRDEDAGREILYQVTQQAFNELLDTIFKPSEDLAIQSAETKAERRKYKDLIAEIDDAELADDKENEQAHQNGGTVESDIASKSLEQLLDDAGYEIDEGAGRNAVEIEPGVDLNVEEDLLDAAPADLSTSAEEPRDLTMPQFRPNTADSDSHQNKSKVNGASAGEPSEPAKPSRKDLIKWKRLNLAEDQARARGGWGKLDFAEFEEIYKRQEKQGNRLDYLGSWIDFCIP